MLLKLLQDWIIVNEILSLLKTTLNPFWLRRTHIIINLTELWQKDELGDLRRRSD
jgi:hypothetical protein